VFQASCIPGDPAHQSQISSGQVSPVGQKQMVLLIEEYDLGVEFWQLT